MIFKIILTMTLALTSMARAEEHHHDDHEENDKHGDHGDHHDEDEGFKISPEAVKHFELQFQKLAGAGPWNLPSSAILLSGEKQSLYRLRNESYQRIEFKLIKKTNNEWNLSSPDLRAGDEIVVRGAGFLRIAELAASGEVSHGHSH